MHHSRKLDESSRPVSAGRVICTRAAFASAVFVIAIGLSGCFSLQDTKRVTVGDQTYEIRVYSKSLLSDHKLKEFHTSAETAALIAGNPPPATKPDDDRFVVLVSTSVVDLNQPVESLDKVTKELAELRKKVKDQAGLEGTRADLILASAKRRSTYAVAINALNASAAWELRNSGDKLSAMQRDRIQTLRSQLRTLKATMMDVPDEELVSFVEEVTGLKFTTVESVLSKESLEATGASMLMRKASVEFESGSPK